MNNLAERNRIKNAMDSNGEIIINNVFEVINPPTNGVLSKNKITEIISSLEYIFKGNQMFTIGKIVEKDINGILRNVNSVKLKSWLNNEINVKCITDINLFEEETKRAFDQYYDWKNKYQSRGNILKEDTKLDKNIKLEIIKIKEEIKKLQIENKELRNEIENLKKNSLSKKRTFSNSQIESIKNMNTHGISTRLIAMEFNCSIEDIKHVIDE